MITIRRSTGTAALSPPRIRITTARRRSRSAGFTLVELLASITAMTALSVTGTLLVILLMSAEQRGTQAVVDQITVGRLAQQWRRDVHAAVTASLEEAAGDPDRVLLLRSPAMADIRWTAGIAGVRREVVDGEQVAQLETYHLPDGSTRFHIDESSGIVQLLHRRQLRPLADTYSDQGHSGAEEEIRISAALRWDGRHAVSGDDGAGDSGD